MLCALSVLWAAPALAETLPVELKGQTATVTTPSGMGVGLALKPLSEGDGPQVSWTNDESSALAIVCSETGKAAEDSFVDVLLLAVGEQKWGLAAGSNVKFTCPAGKAATITDIHDQQIATFKDGVLLSVVKAKSHSAR